MELSELEFKLSKLLHKIEEETELFKQNKRKQPLISVVQTNLVLYQLAVYEFCSFLTKTNQDSISLFLKRINNGYQIQLQSLLKYFQDFLQNKNPTCEHSNTAIIKNLEAPIENNERYVQEINRLNDEIKELEMKMKRKDRLLKEQHQTLEENRLVEKTLQDFFVEHLKENLRQKAQDLHISFASQSLNKQKTTTFKKEKGYFSDEEKAIHHTSSFPKLDEFFPELEKVITNELLNFKKTIREYRTYTTTIQKQLKTPQKNNVTASLPESDKNLQDQIQDILSRKEKALDIKKAEVEKELKKMLLGISTQREDLILAQKEILNTKWMNLCNSGSKYDISLRESLHRARTITNKDFLSELQNIITKPRRKIKMFNDKIDIGTEPDPNIFDIDIVKIQIKRIERLEFELNAGFQDKKTLMGQIELKNKQIIEYKGTYEEIKKKLRIEQISHAEIQIRIKEFIEEAEQQQRIINELEEKVEKKKAKIQSIKAAVCSNNQGALELIRKKTVFVKEKSKNENKDFDDFEKQLKNKINDYKMLHKRGVLEMEKLMVEFEEINIENRKLKYEIARLKEELNRCKKQIQDSKLQTNEKEKEVWRLMQENDSRNNAIEKLLQKNNDLYFDLQKNSNKSELSKEKPEKIEKSERLERIEKLEKLEKLVKYEKFDKSERPEKREKTYFKQTKTNKNDFSSNDFNSLTSLKKFGSQSNEVPIKQKRDSTLSVDKTMNINEVYLNVNNENSNNNNLSAVKSEKKEGKQKQIKSKNKNEKEKEKETEKKNILPLNKEKINSGTGNNLETSNLKYSINIVETNSKKAISENNSYYEDEKSDREGMEEMNGRNLNRSVVPVSRKRKSKKAMSYYEPKLGVRPKKEEVKELDTYPKDYMKTIEAKLQSQSSALEILKKSDTLSSASFEFLEKERQRTNLQVRKNEPRKSRVINNSPNIDKINEKNEYSNKKEEYRFLLKNDMNPSNTRKRKSKDQSESKNESNNSQVNDSLKNDENILTPSQMEKKRKNSYSYLNEQIINEKKNLNAFYKNNEIKSMEKVELPKEMKTNLDYEIENMDKFFPSYKSKKNSDSKNQYLDSSIRKEDYYINKTQDIASFNKKSFIPEQDEFEKLQKKRNDLKNLMKNQNQNNDMFNPMNPPYNDGLDSSFINNQKFSNENDLNDNRNIKDNSSMDGSNKHILKFDGNRKNDKKNIKHDEKDIKYEISENSNNYNENQLNLENKNDNEFVETYPENKKKINNINRNNHQILSNETNRKLDQNMTFDENNSKNLLKHDQNKIYSDNRDNYNFDQENNNEIPLNSNFHGKTLRFIRKAESLSPPHMRNPDGLQSEVKEQLNKNVELGNQMNYNNVDALNEKIHKIKSIEDKERVTKGIVRMPSEIPKNINLILKEEKPNKKYQISRSTQTDSNPSTKSTQTDWIFPENRSTSRKSKSFHSNSTNFTRIPEEGERKKNDGLRRDEGEGFSRERGRKQEEVGGSWKEGSGKKEDVGSLTLDGFNKKSHLKTNNWKPDHEKAYLKKNAQNASKDSSIYSKLLSLSNVPILPSSLHSSSYLPPSSYPPSSSFPLPLTSFPPDPSSLAFPSLPQSSFPPSSFQPPSFSSHPPPSSSFIPPASSSLPPPTLFKEIRKLFYEIIGEEAPPIDSSDFVEIKRIELPERKEFEEFCRIIREEHPRCGVNCEHLKRFYERLGAKKGGREVMVLHKRDIDRLPKIKKVVVV